MSTTNSNSRLRIVSVVIVLVACVFFGKLYILQVIHHDDFIQIADKQYVKNGGHAFSRGTIYFEDKNGELVSAATLKTTYVLTINPTLVKDKEDTYAKINAVVPIDHDAFIAKASKPNDPYEEIAKKISGDDEAKIDGLKLPGVAFYKEEQRFYPGGKTAANVLGFIGYQGDEYAGRYGLEKSYEKTLGRKGDDVYANFFVEVFSDIKKSVSDDQAFEGDVVAGIEPSVQTTLEDTINQVQTKWSSQMTGGIIMNPKTGQIYAMANTPTFDPNNFSQETNVAVFANPAVNSVFELGSIIKTITMASGIDAGVVNAKTTYFDPGYVKANSETIWDHDRKAHGITTMQEVLNQSLNVGVSFVVQKMGTKNFANYLTKFGLREKTGIDLPNEAMNLTSNLDSPRDVEYYTASFGQGVAFTPVSAIAALSVLANGGVRVHPHIIDRIDYKGLPSKTIDGSTNDRVISKSSADAITKMLVEVVDTALLQGKNKNPHYTVAAKTGTAQMADGRGKYSDSNFLHSFFGYFPASDPKFIILLYTINPKTNIAFAADTLGVPFFDLSKFLINYYDVPPDR